jgi:hypothetical protein
MSLLFRIGTEKGLDVGSLAILRIVRFIWQSNPKRTSMVTSTAATSRVDLISGPWKRNISLGGSGFFLRKIIF